MGVEALRQGRLELGVHHVGRRTACEQFFFHEIHVRRHVREKKPVAFAEIVESRLSRRCEGESVFGALSVACKKKFAGAALRGQCVVFIVAEAELAVAVHHLDESVGVYVSEFVLRENEMIA